MVKIIIHLMINHLNWVESAEVKGAVKEAKEKVQEALKPGKFHSTFGWGIKDFFDSINRISCLF